MKKTTITVVMITLAVIMAMPVAAQMRMRGGYGRCYYHPVDITKLPGLNLTDDQILKMKTLRDDHLLDSAHIGPDASKASGTERSLARADTVYKQDALSTKRNKDFPAGVE